MKSRLIRTVLFAGCIATHGWASDEVLKLPAYLRSGGNSNDPAFKQAATRNK